MSPVTHSCSRPTHCFTVTLARMVGLSLYAYFYGNIYICTLVEQAGCQNRDRYEYINALCACFCSCSLTGDIALCGYKVNGISTTAATLL